MRGLARFYVQQVSIGPILRAHSRFHGRLCADSNLRTKEKLRSGDMQIRGDQWPIFLYADLAYDPDDPWNGLLRNQLLITVRFNTQF